MDNFIIFILVLVVIWLLYSILKELRITRTLLELPSDVKKSYDEQLSKLDKEIKSAFALMLVTPKGESEQARKEEFKALVKKREEVLDDRRKHFYTRPEYLK